MNTFSSLFQNLKVVEFATALAGPQTGTFLMELGADVLKIEPPNGDVSRFWKNTFESEDQPESIYYNAINGRKKTIRLDLKDLTCRTNLEAHLTDAHVIITNFTRKKAAQFKLSYQDLIKINPDIILANITGYGQEDDRPAFDILMQAECGLLSMTGHSIAEPAKVPVPIVDILASHQLRSGILCAILNKKIHGKGAEIQVSLLDSAISGLANQAGNFLMGNQIPQPMGTKHPSIAPYGDIFTTADEQRILLAIGSERQFSALCQCIAAPSICRDQRFSDNKSRVINRIALSKLLAQIIRAHPLSSWLEKFRQHQVPAGVIKTLQDVLTDNRNQHMILSEKSPANHVVRRVKNIVF
ncbi:MAG: CoA transferase [Saprospiraceae bacterium]|nr:CoA transferase [Saprospiraceae bacterium]